jgi:hypothetical protein
MKRISLSLLAFLVIPVLLYAPLAQAGDEPEFVITDEWGDLNKVELYNLEFTIDGYTDFSIWPPTRVDMTGGHVGQGDNPDSGMFTYESSTFNMSGGIVEYLHTYNSSTANISGGVVENGFAIGKNLISANGMSVINIYDGAHLTGGSFGFFQLYGSSTLNVHGGDIALLVCLNNSSTVNIYSGSCPYGVSPFSYSTVNVYGGYIGFFIDNVLVPETSTVNIYGYGFHYNPKAFWEYMWDPNDGWWVSKLTGHGCDGRPITYLGLPDLATHPNINLVPDFVPGRGVNLADFAILASAWRSNPGDENWNPICDISDPNDNVIDERDLAILTKYWLAGVK